VGRHANDAPSTPRLTVDRAELDRRLEERILRGRELLDRPISTPGTFKTISDDYYTWHDYNTTLLQGSFSTSEPADEYRA
jgi:hypothetical protein